MKQLVVYASAILGTLVSVPASAVVSLHFAAPHATTMFIGIGRTGVLATLLGVGVVTVALVYRYRKAR